MVGVRELFARSWQLFRENPALVVPGLLLQVLGLTWGLPQLLALHVGHDPSRAAALLAAAMGWLVVSFVGGSYLTAAGFGMSAAAWRTGVATFSDGAASGSRRWWPLGTLWFLAVLIAIPLAVIAYVIFASVVPSAAMQRAALEHPSLAVRLGVVAVEAVLWFLTIYTVPAIVLAGRGAADGLARSVALAWGRARETAVMLVPLAVVGALLFVGGAALRGAFEGRAPAALLFQLVNAVVGGLWGTYMTLVVTGRFLELQGGSEQGLPAETLQLLYE